MRVATLLTTLYPPAVRDRWGGDLRREVAAAGVRGWPDTLAGAARLWLHPRDWPETFAGQTRRVLTVTTVTVAAATLLLLRTVHPSSTLTADLGHPVTSGWLVPLLLGTAVAVPRPALQWAALRRLVTVTVRTLLAPALAVGLLLSVAWSGAADHATGPAGLLLVGYYWLTLGFVALRSCTLVARLGSAVVAPSTRRLSWAFLLMGTGLVLATSQAVLAIVLASPGPYPATAAQVVTLALLSLITLAVGQDLRRTPAARP